MATTHPMSYCYDSDLTVNENEYDIFLDEELTQLFQVLNEELQEMISWDAEDEENRAFGRTIPGITPPNQPYRESSRFKELVQRIQHIETSQRRRIKRDAEDTEDGDGSDEDESNDRGKAVEMENEEDPGNHDDEDVDDITTNHHPSSPLDIREPTPFPPSPNIPAID